MHFKKKKKIHEYMYRQKYALGRIKKNSKNKTFCTVLLNIVDNVPIYFFSPNITCITVFGKS